jgi:uncharacterized protein YqeY
VENTLKARLNSDLRQALRSGDSLRCSVLRLLISAIGYAEMARQIQLSDDDIYAVIAKEIKQRKESIAAFNQGNRPELAAKEEAEMIILAGYMPQQMSVAEIEDLVRRVMAEAGATGPRDKGKVMGRLMPLVKGKADGKEVNTIVDRLLAA